MVDGIKIIAWHVCTDGVDVVGSERVVVRNALIHCNDDCIAVKSVSYGASDGYDWRGDVNDVRIEHCMFYNDQAGNVMEVGFETQADEIRDIIFEDIDVIGAHGYGGVFTIHAGDRAHVQNVSYRDIHIEHFFDKLIDIRILNSRYSVDEQRGQVTGVSFDDIHCVEDLHNCVSIVAGYDAQHLIDQIAIGDWHMGMKKVFSLDDLQCCTRHVGHITFPLP